MAPWTNNQERPAPMLRHPGENSLHVSGTLKWSRGSSWTLLGATALPSFTAWLWGVGGVSVSPHLKCRDGERPCRQLRARLPAPQLPLPFPPPPSKGIDLQVRPLDPPDAAGGIAPGLLGGEDVLPLLRSWASQVVQMVKNLPAMQETWIRSLGWEDPLEEFMATHSNILAWTILWTEESGGLQSIGSQRVRHN